jgi:hypothetical protein
MADERIRHNQDDPEIDEIVSDEEGDIAEIPEGTVDEDEELDD